MGTETGPARDIDVAVEVLPVEADAGAELTLRVALSAASSVRVGGSEFLIKDQDGATVERAPLVDVDREGHASVEIAARAPREPGTYTWSALCRADAVPPVEPVPFSFTVRAHPTSIVVWDVPPAVQRGDPFNVTLGVKCSSECPPAGWTLEVIDHHGELQATAPLSEDAWPGTTALYYARLELKAPDNEGLHRWEARTVGAPSGLPHTAATAGFGVRTVAPPECLLTVLAVDREKQTPVEGARVVVHPYRTVTDERGVARVRVPKGGYRLFVSGGNYFPFRRDGEVTTDTTLRAELDEDRGLSDSDLWS